MPKTGSQSREKSKEADSNICASLTSNSTAMDWAPVSEPGFLKFQISRFSILEILFLLETIFEKYVGEISRNK